MASAVTYEGDVQRAEGNSTGLFAGQKLWFSRSVPARYWLMENAKNNGAQIVELEQQADVKLVDHAKKNQAPGTYSYRYVDESIRNGILEDLELHRVGSASRVDRPVGSVITASKGSRNRFTDAEDQLLWNWLKPYMDAGGAWKGNEIYKQLEAHNPNHTFQSWRDRWIKHTRFQQRHVTEHSTEGQTELRDQPTDDPRPSKRQKHSEPDPPQSQNANISLVQTAQRPPSNLTVSVSSMGNTESTSKSTTDEAKHEQSAKQRIVWEAESEVEGEASGNDEDLSEVEVVAVVDNDTSASTIPEPADNADTNVHASAKPFPTAYGFTQIEASKLYSATCHILDARPDKLEESWADVAREHGHTKEAWQTFFYGAILPEYMKRHGLRTKAELEIHYQSEVRRLWEGEERRKQELVMKKPLDNQSELVNVEQRDPAQSQTKNREDERTDNGQPEITSDELQNTRHQDDDANIRSPELGQSIRNSLHLPQTNSITNHRPPRPNESRKLSLTRGLQSSSSQSQPQSQLQQNQTSMSQHSQISHDVLPVSQISEESNIAKLFQTNSVDTTQSTNSSLATGIRDNLQPQMPYANHNSNAVEPVSTPQLSEDYDRHSSRFVTQISRDEEDMSLASDADLEDIPFRPPMPSWPGAQASSPLFVPEASQQAHPIAQNQIDPASSPAPVLLIDDNEEAESESDQSVEYAPSEAPSEAIQFESHATLSQAWETAPDQNLEVNEQEGPEIPSRLVSNQADMRAQDQVFRTSDESTTDAGTGTGYNTARRSPESSIQLPNRKTGEKSQTEMSTEEEFETAPTEIKRHSAKDQSKHTNKQLDTQALFQQPTQENLAEIAAIPEPPGGWDDEEQDTTIMPIHDVVTEPAPSHEADWTLPLPNLDLDLEDAPPSPSKDADGIDINDWLVSQSKIYSSMPSQLLNPFSHYALESTSMDISLATVVLEQMVQRFTKGEHSSRLTASAIRKLAKRQRKSTVMKIAEELAPSDVRGCWTRHDDKSLLGDNGREVKRVEDKHGVDSVKTRFEFLEMWHFT